MAICSWDLNVPCTRLTLWILRVPLARWTNPYFFQNIFQITLFHKLYLDYCISCWFLDRFNYFRYSITQLLSKSSLNWAELFFYLFYTTYHLRLCCDLKLLFHYIWLRRYVNCQEIITSLRNFTKEECVRMARPSVTKDQLTNAREVCKSIVEEQAKPIIVQVKLSSQQKTKSQ